MTKQDYLKLVQKSEAFQILEEGVKQAVLSAEGSAAEEYAKMFYIVNQLQDKNREEFIERTRQIYTRFTEDLKHKVKEMQKTAEAVMQSNAEVVGEQLIKQLKNEK